MSFDIAAFVRESNRIEGILRDPTDLEITATDEFLCRDQPSIVALKALVAVLQPNARIRDREGLNVRVGAHYPPPGGPQIVPLLARILVFEKSPYWTHHAYETLHPFTDGNGRSGRALWAWQMLNQGEDLSLGFLHTWYYQSLQNTRPLQSCAAEGATISAS